MPLFDVIRPKSQTWFAPQYNEKDGLLYKRSGDKTIFGKVTDVALPVLGAVGGSLLGLPPQVGAMLGQGASIGLNRLAGSNATGLDAKDNINDDFNATAQRGMFGSSLNALGMGAIGGMGGLKNLSGSGIFGKGLKSISDYSVKNASSLLETGMREAPASLAGLMTTQKPRNAMGTIKYFRLGGKAIRPNHKGLYKDGDHREDYLMVDKKTKEVVGEARYNERIFDQKSNAMMEAIMGSELNKDEKQERLGKHIYRELLTHEDINLFKKGGKSCKTKKYERGGKSEKPRRSSFTKEELLDPNFRPENIKDWSSFVAQRAKYMSTQKSATRGSISPDKVSPKGSAPNGSPNRTSRGPEENEQGSIVSGFVKRVLSQKEAPPTTSSAQRSGTIPLGKRGLITPESAIQALGADAPLFPKGTPPSGGLTTPQSAPSPSATSRVPARSARRVTSIGRPSTSTPSAAASTPRIGANIPEPSVTPEDFERSMMPDTPSPIPVRGIQGGAANLKMPTIPVVNTPTTKAVGTQPTWSAGDILSTGFDASKAILSAIGASRPLPTYELPDSFMQYKNTLETMSKQGFTPNEIDDATRRINETYANDVGSIRATIGGGGNAGMMLANLNRAALNRNNGFRSLAIANTDQRRRNMAAYGGALQTEIGADRINFQNQFTSAQNARNNAGQSMMLNLQNIQDRIDYNRTQPMYNKYLDALTRSIDTYNAAGRGTQ
jgi:hypothetical protein